MKAGTTWLYNILSKHPDLYFSYEKEIHYFAHLYNIDRPLSKEFRINRTKNAIGRLDAKNSYLPEVRKKLLWYSSYVNDPIDDNWYVNLFSFRARQNYCADFSNLYCQLGSDGWDHVKRITNNMRVIYIMRDPLDRLWSHIKFHLKITGQSKLLDVWNAQDYNAFARQPFIWDNFLYAEAVERLQENISNDSLKIVFFEEIHRAPREWLFELEKFLGIRHIDYDEEILKARINTTDQIQPPPFFNSLFAQDVEEQIYKISLLGHDAPDQWRIERKYAP